MTAELASTKTRLCGHGIDRSRGKCHDCEKSQPTPTDPTQESSA